MLCCMRRTSPLPLHAGQTVVSVPGSAPDSLALRAHRQARHLDLFLRAEYRLLELDRQAEGQVSPALWRVAPRARCPSADACRREEGLEDVRERPEALERIDPCPPAPLPDTAACPNLS